MLFLEPSTRTRLSFASAAYRLGASVVFVSGNDQESSLAKGESVSDTVKALDCYCDCLVIRHSHVHGVAALSSIVSKPVISAGSHYQASTFCSCVSFHIILD